MKSNRIYTAYVAWKTGGKRRPVLVVEDNDNSVTVLKITTKYQSKSSKIKKYYYPIIDWQKSGLKEKSYIDTIKKVNLLKSDVSFHYVGRLSSQDKNGLRKFIDELG
ncbi:MazF family toxin-antitoxin system [Lactobacillus amylovorus]|uniref:MazF family toxin-antitoxin system n=1 Tax=Lactobacillus amylovorus TaxID=1604 RepID=A0A5B8EFH0_LACAM|nr:type II toxin-antitoxin system PemK/MazF family toxin [Lactobacillus amylovorus]MDB6229722.1 type II toxin-antitoxin system PemK/MazF family toxin [Lactobacillus amylovorus]NME31208.1 type II toxin-antitoxin system PemK/MazF family toxin [Lactobacillus amylovorus]QDD69621.1 MazF family toxin-antitoxin system [Lactobacillus amylovorus]